ncbi:pentapeptide repeat-containing protein [Litoreibacter roseus]|uniref:Pentapeptide repeat-containing protein n=1 Tax=Litoreibacter roseus TaxID=2601869 RepID=A0A6N6JLR3_9RHOB|nr:pentapeptide repeat-containing protein [Litoreibacter roseus]GFE67243.1 hypothetical protein KIN_43170 [Litoreibacter roseus]
MPSSFLTRILKTLGLLLAGLSAGSAITVLFINVSGELLEGAMLVGIIAGLAAFVLFLLLRIVLINLAEEKLRQSLANSEWFSELQEIVDITIKRYFPKNDEGPEAAGKLANFLPTSVQSLASAGSAWLATSATLALVVAMAGAVVSLGTIVVAYRQIDRLDQQNTLIQQQIFEAKATRVSSVFAAQLPGLLAEIDRLQPNDASQDWDVPPSLAARIQAVINLAEPYAPDTTVDGWKATLRSTLEQSPNSTVTEENRELYGRLPPEERFAEDVLFSPERGQLLLLLLATRFPFESLPSGLDFSNADLRGLKIAPSDISAPTVLADLGETVLNNANLRDADISNVDFSRTSLQGAILPRPGVLSEGKFFASLAEHRMDARSFNWLTGANLSHAILDVNDGASRIAMVQGGVNFLGQFGPNNTPFHRLWRYEDNQVFMVVRPSEKLSATANTIRRFFSEIGAVEITEERCNDIELPSLQAVRELVGASDQYASQYATWLLSEYDASLLNCVID